jgi:hypothetical protein
LLGDFSAKLGTEDIFKPTVRKESLHVTNDDGIRVVNFAISKNLIVIPLSLSLPFSSESLDFLSPPKYIKIKIYKTMILPAVLYGYETLSPTIREEHRLRVFENRVLRRVFGPRREEWAGGWRIQHNEELYNLYASSNFIRVIKSSRMGWGGHVAWMGEMGNAYIILVGKPEEKRPLGRPRHKWQGNIRIDLRELRWENVDWMHRAQDRDQ